MKFIFNDFSIDEDISDIEYTIISQRNYGEPKLKKPKELKNIKNFAIIRTQYTYRKPGRLAQLFRCGNDLYIKHPDFHSRYFEPPVTETWGSLHYLLKKYFRVERPEKFCYEDSWGEIIFVGEAWIKISNVFAHQFKNYLYLFEILKRLYSNSEGWDEYELYRTDKTDIRLFLEEVSKEVLKYIES